MRSQPGWTTILAWVWLVGIAVLLLYTWISTQRLRRKVREAVRLQGNIYETEHIASPFVLGVLSGIGVFALGLFITMLIV